MKRRMMTEKKFILKTCLLLTGYGNKCMLEIWILCFDYKPMQLYFLKGWKSLRQIFIIYVHFFGTPISIFIIAILTYIFTINFFKHQLLLFDKYSLPSWLWHCTLHRHSLTSVHLVTAVLQWVVSKDIAISDTADTAPQQDQDDYFQQHCSALGFWVLTWGYALHLHWYLTLTTFLCVKLKVKIDLGLI